LEKREKTFEEERESIYTRGREHKETIEKAFVQEGESIRRRREKIFAEEIESICTRGEKALGDNRESLWR